MKNFGFYLSPLLGFFLCTVLYFVRERSPINLPRPFEKTVVYQQVMSRSFDSVDNSTNVILLTYMRSGSTLLGEVFKSSPDVFYFYEPFRVLEKRLSNSTSYRNLEILKTKDFTRHLLKLMKELFDCNLAASFIPISNPDWFKTGNLRALVYMSSFSQNLREIMNSKELLDAEIAKCRAAKLRVIKTIRVNGFESIWDEVQSGANIKVIHLIRDPRGVQNSRLRLAEAKNLLGPRSVCDEPMKSIHFKQLHELDTRGRYYEIIFDHFAVSPVPKLKEMFSFLGMDLSQEVEHLVRNLTESRNKVIGGYNARERNAILVAKGWEKELKKQDRISIENDKTCKQLIDYIYGN